MEETEKAACRRSTAVRIGNDGKRKEEESENEEQEEEEEKKMASPLKNSAQILDDVCVKMAGSEITQKQEQKAVTIESSSSSRSRTVESKQCLPSSSSSSVPPPPPLQPLKPVSGLRSSEGGREGPPPSHHRVTFAEPCNRYVHSDSGIVLSPDDAADYGDVIGGGGGPGNDGESDDDDSDDVDDADDVRDRRHPRLTPVNTNAVPGPPIIKLHRCRSTESHDNPFLFDGELSRKADYIITHSTFLRTCVRVADPDQISPEPTESRSSNQGPDCVPPTAETVSRRNSATPAPDPPADVRSVSPGCPPATPQRSAVKTEPQPRLNGDTERPLLSPPRRKKREEGNGLGGGLKNGRQSKSKRAEICCVVQ